MRSRLMAGLLAGVALTLLLSACGGSDNKNNSGSSSASSPTAAPQVQGGSSSGSDPYGYGSGTSASPSPAAQAGTAPSPAGATAPQAIEVKALNPDFGFDPKEITVKPGAVTVTLTNVSTARPHNFAVRKLSGDGDIAKSQDAPANGGTAKVDFTITEEGTYTFYCTLPGHADRGQKGTLTVKRS